VRVTPFNVLHCCDFMDCVLGGELSPVAVSFFSCFFWHWDVMLLAWWILLCVMSNDSLAGPKKPHLKLHICGAIFLGLVLCTSQLEPELQYHFLTMVVSLCLF
jgi:hypothetical protein